MFNFFRISFRLLYNRVCWTICVSADENNNMKVWLTAKTKWVGDSRSFHSISQLSLLLLCLTVFLWRCEAAKGGAKSVINRNRQRGRGNSYIGNNHSDDGADAAGTGKQRQNQSQTRPRHSFCQERGKNSQVAELWAWSLARAPVSESAITSRKEESIWTIRWWRGWKRGKHALDFAI